MRLCFLVLLACVIAASAWPVDQHSLRVPGVNGWYVPQTNGGLRWVSQADGERQLEFYEGQEELGGRLSTNTVKFYLYTQRNPSTGQEIKATQSSIDASNFNPKHATRITIHGWNSNYKDGVNTRIADAWFQYGDYNMIAVDWSRGRSLEYATSVSGAPGAGKKVAALVDFLVASYGMSLDSLEIVGFSLGAHVAGHTGKQLTSGKAGKIVGLDPASPLLSYSKTEKRLSSEDAVYVESIQTNGAILGFTQPIGKAAFYMNGGRSQPGCGIDLTGSCSHTRAVLYYVEALLWNNFPSKSCETYQEANKNACGDRYSSITMGAAVNIFVAEGIFYVPVNKDSPYGFGEVVAGSTTTEGPVETSTTTVRPTKVPSTTAAPEDDSTTGEPEETSSTTGAPEVPTTTSGPTDVPSTTTSAEDGTTIPEEDSTTKEPEEVSTTAVPEVPSTTSGPTDLPSTTASPGEETTIPEEDTTTGEPEETSSTTAAPEIPSTTASPEDETTLPEEESTTGEPEDVTTTADPEIPSGPTEDPSTTAAPEEDSTTEEAEEVSTTAAPEVSTTTSGPTELPSTTASPEDETTLPEEDTTTGEPEEVTTTAVPEIPSEPTELPSITSSPEDETTLPEEETTTEEPEEVTTTAVPEVPSTTSGPTELPSTTAAPEDDSTTGEPEEVSTTPVPEVPSTTSGPTELPSTTASPEEETTVPEEDSTTEEPEEVSTTAVPTETPTTTAQPVESPTTTPVPTELPSTPSGPEVTPTLPPNIDDNSRPGSTKNIFIFNVFLVNVKVSK